MVWVPSALLAVATVVLSVAVVRLRRRVDSLMQEVARATVPKTPQSSDGGFETSVVESVEASSTSGNDQAYVVTEMVPTVPGTPDRRIQGSLFADLVLRESVVKAASYVHGVRRALAPETRNRIRFEMRQEVKRSRKQRRVDLRTARRHLADRQRADEDAA